MALKKIPNIIHPLYTSKNQGHMFTAHMNLSFGSDKDVDVE